MLLTEFEKEDELFELLVNNADQESYVICSYNILFAQASTSKPDSKNVEKCGWHNLRFLAA